MPEIPAPMLPNVVLGGVFTAASPKPVAPPQKDQRTADESKTEKSDATQSAAVGEEPPNTTPIGELSAAPNTQGLPSRVSLSREIKWIQQQLNQIHRQLNPKDQRTASQIRTFLSKAANALQAGDLDGANTLTVKARVLLSEIR